MSLATVQETGAAANPPVAEVHRTPPHGGNVGFSRRANPKEGAAAADGGKVFHMAKVKDDGFKSLDRQKRGSSKFDKFLRNSAVLDKFLHEAVAYVRSVLKADGLLTEGKPADDDDKKSSTSGSVRKKAAHVRSAADEKEVKSRLKEMGATYATIILAESNYQQWRQEQIFYEAFYELTVFVVNTYTEGKFEDKVDDEIGRIFRTNAFNFSKRNESSSKSVLSARELYALRYEGDSYSNNRILATLHPRNREQSVHRYLNAHSPIIATVLPDDANDNAEAVSPDPALDAIEGGMATMTSMATMEDAGSGQVPAAEMDVSGTSQLPPVDES